eukprot:TRINITY_DN2618_c0_g1_i9.p3 TRINITY_DN2618_c0_g1~~TRINITY_DN2618_c0_g1_i9.p3  ORF type:complete len:228 (-),score=51.31 TRINITY_DN2618_c0_g1_i9:2061-2744(-)
MSLCSMENAFAALMAKDSQVIGMESSDDSQGVGSNQEEELQVVQDPNPEEQEPDLEELERQLFGSGVRYRMMSWADEADEMDEILLSQSFSHLTDLSDTPSGSSPRMQLGSCTSLSSMSKHSNSNNISKNKSKLTNRCSTGGSLPFSRTEDDDEEEEGGEWIQVKNQMRKQKKRSQKLETQQSQNTTQSSGNGNEQKSKKRSRRKRRSQAGHNNNNKNNSPTASPNK